MGEIRIVKNLVYARTEKEVLTADVYLPVGKKDIPSVVLIHGGGFRFGTAEMYAEWGVALAERGICAMSINYRLSNRKYAGYPGIVDDLTAAIEYLVERANEWQLDPYEMGLMGDSAGAYLAFMQTFGHDYASHCIRLIVGAYGVYDLIAWEAYNDIKWAGGPNVVSGLMGGRAENDMQRYRDASPLYWIEDAVKQLPGIRPEVLLLWGELDDFVPAEDQSVPFAEKLKQCGISTQTIVFPDAAHLWFPRDPINRQICSLDKYPNSVAAPKILDFIESVFAKPRFTPVEGELTCIARSRKKYAATHDNGSGDGTDPI